MFKRSSILLLLATLSSAGHAVVLLDSPGAGEPYLGCTPQCLQSLQLWGYYGDPTLPLWDQIDEAGVIDGDSVVYDRAVLAPTTGSATHISWNGLGSPGLGFIIGIWDQSVQPATPAKGMPGTVVPGGGTLVAKLSLPTDTLATSPSVNGMTHYDATIPPLQLTAGHLYKVSISAISGTFQWEVGAEYLNHCWNSTECKNWMWYTGAVRYVFGSVPMGWAPMAYQLSN